jgi:flavin-dependent dehydrogenase
MLRYVAVQEWYGGDGTKIPPYACVFDEKTSDSCSWTIRKDGLALFGGAFRRDGCRKAFAEQKSRLEEHLGQAFGDPVRREGCFVSSPRKWRDFIPGRAGVYLCGEAAGFISASSFEGISSAILSGKLLAEAFLSGQNAEEIIRQYRRKTLGLRLKLWCKIPKMRILCSPTLRSLIMRSGVQSVKRYR